MRCSARCSYMSTCLGEHILLPLLCGRHLQDVPLGGLSRHGDAGLVADLGPHNLVYGRIRCQRESTYDLSLISYIWFLFSHCNWVFFFKFYVIFSLIYMLNFIIPPPPPLGSVLSIRASKLLKYLKKNKQVYVTLVFHII